MEEIKELINQMRKYRRGGDAINIPDPLDLMYINLAERFTRSNESEREQIRNFILDDSLLFILGFSGRLAALAARRNDSRLILLALVAHSIEDFRFDPRENYPVLAVVYHAAEKMGLNASDLFEKVAQISTSATADRLRAFAGRDPVYRDLKYARIEEVMTDEGIDYRSIE